LPAETRQLVAETPYTAQKNYKLKTCQVLFSTIKNLTGLYQTTIQISKYKMFLFYKYSDEKLCKNSFLSIRKFYKVEPHLSKKKLIHFLKYNFKSGLLRSKT